MKVIFVSMDGFTFWGATITIIVAFVFAFLYLASARHRDVKKKVRSYDAGGERRAVRNRASRNRLRTGNDEHEGFREEHARELLEENNIENNIDEPLTKIGTKKLRKLENKAEKRRLREIELQEREERKQKAAEEDERRRREELKQELEERKRVESQRKIEEQKKQQEHDEYLKMKAAFEVEEEGFDQVEVAGQLTAFIDYMTEQKVIQLEDLAAHFKLKTQDCIDRVQRLLEEEVLCGVIDDRGKFISISRQELEEVATFIKVRGRVSIQELVENSNRLINLSVSG